MSVTRFALACRWLVLAAMVLGWSLPSPGQQDPPATTESDGAAVAPAVSTEQAPGNVTEASNYQTKFLVRVSVDRPSRDYRAGEQIRATVVSEIEAFVYVFYKQADGKTFLIFPNSEQPNNRLPARQSVQIPASGDNFRWEVAAPFGKERLTVLASTQKLDSLNDPRLRAELFNPVPGKMLKGVELELGAEKPAEWSIQHIDLTTYDRSEPLPANPSRRFGVFFGVAEYQFNAEAELASKEGRGLNLPTCHLDARELGGALRDLGEFDDVRVYTNQQATKEQVQESITRWLAGVSRPGDACFIYFSGHGGQIPDLSGDEKPDPGTDDKNDETLVPYGYLGYSMYEKAQEMNRAGTLPPDKLKVLQAVDPVLAQFPEKYQKALALELLTTITDDEFGNWLHQALDGRQIVVILDSCHSGGFGTAAKGELTDRAAPVAFDFLDEEISRMKDIGQADTALLATCSPFESVIVPREEDFPLRLSLMTYFMVEQLQQAKGPVELEASYQNALAKMTDYFARRDLKPTLPQFHQTLKKRVYLKP